MDCMNPTEADGGLREALEEAARNEVQQACYALGGTHGPRRKAAKRQLIESLSRLQHFAERVDQ